jgi:hypoxanthine phosphoribosyltransferase
MLGPVAISAERLARRVDELAAAIRAEASRDLVLAALLPEAALFADDLARLTDAPVEGVRVSRFRPGIASAARVDRDGTLSIAGRDVRLVVTVLDTGLRARLVVAALAQERPRTLGICVLCDRVERRLVADLPLRHVGFRVPDTLLAGYGLGDEHRHLREVCFADAAQAEIARRRRLAIA